MVAFGLWVATYDAWQALQRALSECLFHALASMVFLWKLRPLATVDFYKHLTALGILVAFGFVAPKLFGLARTNLSIGFQFAWLA